MNRILLILFSLISFGSFSQSYTLQQCISYGLSNNLEVEASKLYTDQLYQSERYAKAEFLPTVGVYGNHYFSSGNILNDATATYESKTFQHGEAGITARYSLFEGMKRVAQTKVAQAQVKQGAANLKKQKNELAMQIAMSYLNILYTYSVAQNIENQITVTRQQLLRTESLVNAGASTKSELLRLRYTLADEEVLFAQNSNSLKMNILELQQLMNFPSDSAKTFAIDTTVQVAVNEQLLFSVDSVFNTAITIMPEIIAAQYSVETSQHMVQISKSAYYPQLALQANYGSNYTSLRTDTYSQQFGDNMLGELGLQLTIPIFNKGQTRISVAKSNITVLESENKLAIEKQQLYKSIQLAYNEVYVASENYKKQSEALVFRAENFRLAHIQFNAGALSSLDYNIEKTEYLKAQNDLEQSKYLFVFKKVLYNFYATGTVTL